MNLQNAPGLSDAQALQLAAREADAPGLADLAGGDAADVAALIFLVGLFVIVFYHLVIARFHKHYHHY